LPEKVTVTNGSSGNQRVMLRQAAIQLQDMYGNAAGACGVQVSMALLLRSCHILSLSISNVVPPVIETKVTCWLHLVVVVVVAGCLPAGSLPPAPPLRLCGRRLFSAARTAK
jgi:hypothetical protein